MYVYRQEKKIVWVFSPFPPSEKFYFRSFVDGWIDSILFLFVCRVQY